MKTLLRYFVYLIRLLLILGGMNLWITHSYAQPTYCVPTTGFGCATDHICSVSLNGCNVFTNAQTSGVNDCNGTAFADFTTLTPAKICAGGTITAQINSVCCSGAGCPAEFTQFLGLWIDLNGDNDFTDPGEFINSTATAMASWNVNFVIPVTATCGTTRMRIRSRWAGPAFTASDACTALFDWGEAEDYNFSIVKLLPPTAASFTFCQGNPQTMILTPDMCANVNSEVRWYDAPAIPALKPINRY